MTARAQKAPRFPRPEVLRAFFIGLTALVLSLASVPAFAQLDTSDPQQLMRNWGALADRAQRVVASEEASDSTLETLREDITAYRTEFGQARDANTARVSSLEAQLKALGPKPEEGVTEPDDVAQLRANLTEQLAQLKAPQIIADEAYLRANGLVTEIDTILRNRQTDALMKRDPIPLLPTVWPGALADIRDATVSLVSEVTKQANDPNVRSRAWNNLPESIVLWLVGLILVLRGIYWSKRLGAYALTHGGRGGPVWSFLATLFMIAGPFVGLLAIVEGVLLTGFYGARTKLLLDAVPVCGLFLLGYHWLGLQMTGLADDDGTAIIRVNRRSELRLLIDLQGLMLALNYLADLYVRTNGIDSGSKAVVVFPIILLSSMLLLRMLQLGLMDLHDGTDDGTPAPAEQTPSAFSGWVPLLRRFVVVLAIIAPILAGVGYVAASQAIIFPLVQTLTLIAVTLILQRFIGAIYALVAGIDDSTGDNLFTVLIGFILAVAMLPVLALIWGARISDLTELWSRFLQGYDIGGVVISPTSFLVFVAIFAVGLTVTRLIQAAMRNSILPKTKIDPGGQAAMVSGMGYVGIFLAALVAITGAGINLSSLAIVAGALSVGIGFGLQTIVSNFVSGIILLIERPISKGDWIDVGGQMGYVRDISVRSTRIETFDRTDVILPNSDLISGTVVNYTRGNTVGRVIVPVGVAYGTDTRKVEKVLLEIANSHPMVLANPGVVFQGFGADSLNFEIRAILRDVNWMLVVKSEMNHTIAKRFAEEGFEIPFAQRDIWLRNPEVLPGAQAFHGGSRHNFSAEEIAANSTLPTAVPHRDIEPDDPDGDNDR
ncbi:DUF3772 domain-containing protein [Chachezhania sediminis]|uniref:DUF3772 domain-containing protein n=1 Tax=Chachezhania sediminis TaxID=2599291 RepID=UPI00131B6DD8|nr:DUF3772 domain-containing protein [Chachezhania sediminis]